MMNIAAERARLSPDFDIGHYEPSKRLFLGLSRGWGWFAAWRWPPRPSRG
jgi:hypothetical protein